MMFDLVSKEFWLHHLAVCFAFVVFVLSVNAKLVFGEDQRVPRGLSALTDLANLPLLRTGTWLTGTDSHDVTGGNNDGFEGRYSYLYKDGDNTCCSRRTVPDASTWSAPSVSKGT